MPALKTAAPAKKYYKMKDNVTGYLLLAPWLFGFFFMADPGCYVHLLLLDRL